MSFKKTYLIVFTLVFTANQISAMAGAGTGAGDEAPTARRGALASRDKKVPGLGGSPLFAKPQAKSTGAGDTILYQAVNPYSSYPQEDIRSQMYFLKEAVTKLNQEAPHRFFKSSNGHSLWTSFTLNNNGKTRVFLYVFKDREIYNSRIDVARLRAAISNRLMTGFELNSERVLSRHIPFQDLLASKARLRIDVITSSSRHCR